MHSERDIADRVARPALHGSAVFAAALTLFLSACSDSDSSGGGGTSTFPVPVMVAGLSTPEDTPTPVMDLTGTDPQDAEADLQIDVSGAPANGTLDVTSGAAPLSVAYTPAQDFNGTDSFSFTVTDSDGNVSSPMAVDIEVTPVNDAPELAPIGTQFAALDQPFSFVPTVDDPDVGDVFQFTLEETGLALPAWASFDGATGEISGTPTAGDVGIVTGLRIEVEDSGAETASSNLFTLTVGTTGPAQLAFETAPEATQPAGATWVPFAVRVEDEDGMLVPTSGVDVTIELVDGSLALGGTLTQRTFNGIATFDDLSYETAEDIVLDVTSTDLTGIAGVEVSIVAGPAQQLGFGLTPSAFEQQGTIWSAFSVQVQDEFGNVVLDDDSTSITVALSSGTGTLAGTRTRTVAAGEAFYTDILYSAAETITLEASAAGLAPVLSTPITIQPALPPGLEIERASVATGTGSGPGVGGNAASSNPSASESGRFITYESTASNLVAGDSNSLQDVFVHDRVSGITSRLSIHSDGTQGNGPSFLPVINANGNFVAFASDATNFGLDTNGVRDIFVHDRSSRSTVRVSVASDGSEANGSSERPSISGDGRYVAFESDATNLVDGDTNGARDIFVHDRLTGETFRASLGQNGAEADGPSFAASCAFRGGHVAFESDATNLVLGDTNGVRDIFMHDMGAGTTMRCSVDENGVEGNGPSQAPALSGDGTLVAYTSDATNLVDMDTNGVRDVFLHDTGTHATLLVSRDSAGTPATAASEAPSISDDGRFVAFESGDSGLEADDLNGVDDVFVHDLLTEETYRVSRDRDGHEGNGRSGAAALSCDGQYVAFESEASNLVIGDVNGVQDVFIAPNQMAGGGGGMLPTGIVRSSVDSDGNQVFGPSFSVSLSDDGRFAAFESLAADLTGGDTNFQVDVFVRDHLLGTTRRVSLATSGAQGIGEARLPSISGDGRFIAFESLSDNYVGGDTNGVRDIFVHDLVRRRTERVSVYSDGVQLGNHSFSPSISADGRFVAFETLQDNIEQADGNGRRDVYVHDRTTGHTELVSINEDGMAGDGDSYGPVISSDGTYVAFFSRAQNLVEGDTSRGRDVFLRNRNARTTIRVSVDSDGMQAEGSSFAPSISADGKTIAFESDAANLVTDDTNGMRDVFVHDVATGMTERVSVDSLGMEVLGMSFGADVSDDGDRVAFHSAAPNLVTDDTNFASDIFIRERAAGLTLRMSLDEMDMQANGESRFVSLSGDGRYASFESDASDLVTGDTNGVLDVFTTPLP